MDGLDTVSTAYQTPSERDAATKSLTDYEFKSGLKVFADHCGFRRGELHTFIGTKGSGKSTWSKTILGELGYSEKGVLLYISEERKNKYLSSLNNSFALAKMPEETIKKYLENIIVLGELDSKITNENVLFETMEKLIIDCDLDVLIFDNFTTSFLSELPINAQSRILRRFKELADKLDIPVILFFHTGKLKTTSTLDGDNVRGSGTAINIGSYNYIITQFKEGQNLRNFIFTEKSRYHSRANKKMYEIIYDYRVGMFVKCADYHMEDFQALISGKFEKNQEKGFR